MKLRTTEQLDEVQKEQIRSLLSRFRDLPRYLDHGEDLSFYLEDDGDYRCFVLIFDQERLVHTTLCHVDPDCECSIFAFTAPDHRRLGLAMDAFDALCAQLADEYPDEQPHCVLVGNFSRRVQSFVKALGYEGECEYLLSAEPEILTEACRPAQGACSTYASLEMIPVSDDADREEFEGSYEEIFDAEEPLFEDTLDSPDSEAYLLKIGEDVIGTAILTRGEGSACLSHFGILPDFRGQGLARKALAEIGKLAGTTVTVQVSGGNNPAYRLYLSSGFKEVQKVMSFELYI